MNKEVAMTIEEYKEAIGKFNFFYECDDCDYHKWREYEDDHERFRKLVSLGSAYYLAYVDRICSMPLPTNVKEKWLKYIKKY
jgi:hypothetical protein